MSLSDLASLGSFVIAVAVVSNYEYETFEAVWLAESDNVASVVYTFAWSGIAGGSEVKGSGRGTRVFRREIDGWRIAHEYLSTGTWRR